MNNHLTGTLGLTLDFSDPAFEFQFGVQLDQFFAVGLFEVQVFQADIQWHINFDRRQLIRQKGHFAVLFELGRQVFSAADWQGRHDIEFFVQVHQATTDAHQQARRGLWANARDARNVIRRVAHQGEVIDDLLR